MQIAFTALYCHLWPVWLYHIFPQSQNGKIFNGKLFNIKRVFRFSLPLLPEIIQRGTINAHVKYLLSMSDSNDASLFFTDFLKYLQIPILILKTPSVESTAVPCKRTDRQTRDDEAKYSLFAILRTRLKNAASNTLTK